MRHNQGLFTVGDTFCVKIERKVGDCYFLSGIPYPFTEDGLRAIWDSEDDSLFEEYERLGRKQVWNKVIKYIAEGLANEAVL